MKEKELKEKGELSDAPVVSDHTPSSELAAPPTTTVPTTASSEPKLDEIQMFKMMMKREQQRAGQTADAADPMSFLSKLETTMASTEGRSSSTEPSTGMLHYLFGIRHY